MFPLRSIKICFVDAIALAIVLQFATVRSSAQEDVAETPKAKAVIDDTPIAESPITDADRSHWAFAPVKRPAFPAVTDKRWLRTRVDAFIASKLEAKGIPLAAEADRETLLRRLSFDLIGLPPTPPELAAFESDKSPDAFERQADRLLAAPAFGERWGQYWLDLARFAETDGFEHDYVRPEAWRFRDWVIAALNRDLPYDDFVRLQLAGDELKGSGFGVEGSGLEVSDIIAEKPSDTNAKTAKAKSPPPKSGQIPSMFCLSGPDMPDVNDQAERRHNLLNELTGAVGSVFLGLQMACAQCHDHKYDPLSQADFYRLRAVFEPAVGELRRDAPYNVMSNQKDLAPARFWIRGDHRRPGLELVAAFPRIASAADSAIRNPQSAISTTKGSRTNLAEWLVSPSNPLTSRVIANRLWQHHFGRGICTTPSDFGVMSGPVTHPELLDWLAMELRDNDWGLKRLHRLIVSSATYRQISDFKLQISDLKAGDSENLKSEIRNLKSDELYSRFPRRRLDGEAIRDAMLASAGLLTSERGGPGVMPPLPEEMLSTLLKGQWATSKRQADHYKRSVYVFARRNLRYPIFEAFDRPDGNASCPIRNQSTTAPQSLLLFNSELSLLAARHMAGRIMAQAADSRNQIEQLYLLALSRRPTPSEATILEKFLADQRQRLASESRPREELALPTPCPDAVDSYSAAALVDACVAVLNANEFIYVD